MSKSKAGADRQSRAEERERRWRLDAPHLIAFLLAVLNVILWGGILFSARGIQGYLSKRAEVQRLERDYTRLISHNKELFEHIQRFKKDPRYQEKRVREELGWCRRDEIVFEFPPAPPPRLP